jgi:hypothetical protein
MIIGARRGLPVESVDDRSTPFGERLAERKKLMDFTE